MNRNQAFPIIYRKLKESGVTMDSLFLIERLKSFETKVKDGDITDQHIQSIVNQIVKDR